MHGLQKFLLFNALTCLGEIVQGSKIIHGEKAKTNSMLYMASVQNKNGHVCGGFLITDDYVVTAAHCDDIFPTTHVLLGDHNLKNRNVKNISIKKKTKHESYKETGCGDDIMLLKLSTKVQLGSDIEIIPIPSAQVTLQENATCQVAGWGKTEKNTQPDELRVVNVSIISRKVCKDAWGGLPANVICAGGYKTVKGICQGDSGGPLVHKGIAVGIVSFNKYERCEYPDVPNVYTDISKYRKWIRNIVNHTKIFV